ncbi:hypothetical protein PV328_012207 [Microctonus aethiopoides]|uniref:Uncharacterized protein n=1 Tax=Microctonus aethiopoides TaxID=144406 RepID=A0AA39FGT6_9HYME|nr:hypothetical protein PV328_012207 [Microctonus aethiopoides]
MSTPTEDKDELIENFQALEFDDSYEDSAVNKVTVSAASSSSSLLFASDEGLFKSALDIESVNIKKKLLMEQLKELELAGAAILEQNKQIDESSTKKILKSTKAKWNKKGELHFFSSGEEDDVKDSPKDVAKQNLLLDDEEYQLSDEKTVDCKLEAQSSSLDEARARQIEMKNYRPPLKSSVRAQERPTSIEAINLIKEIRSRSPPRIKFGKTTRVTAAQLHAENVKRGRIPKEKKELEKLEGANRPRLTTDDPNAQLAPSVAVLPAAYKPPTFKEFLGELGLEKEVQEHPGRPLYFVECRMLSEDALKDLIRKRAEMLYERKDSQTVTRGTQTYVSVAGKLRVQGCVNCRSRTHHARECTLPYRPGFCQICFADGFDTKDCIYPHGIEHETALGLCAGCGQDLSLYCPECPDCNVRYKDIVDWLRLNYATMPSWAVPEDHRYLINEGTEILRRRVKAKFDDPNDVPNRVRAFLIRENALSAAPAIAGRNVPSMNRLSEEKRRLAISALTHPLTNKTLDEIFEERPELDDGAEIKIIVPTKYKYGAKK